MVDYTKTLPKHIEKYIGENDLFLEIFEAQTKDQEKRMRPPLVFVHGAYTGSWMWSKYIPHFLEKGFTCYVMNMRSHYKSRVMDMSEINFEDYLEDIKAVIDQCSIPPIILGFSMGGILSQKIAEEAELKGLVLIDTSISKEVNRLAPYKDLEEIDFGLIIPAPCRPETSSIDESEEDIIFQRKYLSMESSKVIKAISCWVKGVEGISINSSLITCPCLVVKAVSDEFDERMGKTTAEHLNAEYMGVDGTTHTGLLIGQRYFEVVQRILEWLDRY
ncbi:alpha/beta hydrolase [Clostridium sp. C8-1-8]|uniref:alpha/beta hydrolase n=1 Tax=Clostridium sp. C8-1-8 TaxID=2698831 RepID=UPI0013710A1A|nr:alpha/beta hydrolase [Clostridium sp. C8-1-8]